MKRNTSRREFIKTTALAGAGLVASGPFLLSAERGSPNDKLNIAIIGAGGRGASNAGDVSGENIVAGCEVNQNKLKAARARISHAQKETHILQRHYQC